MSLNTGPRTDYGATSTSAAAFGQPQIFSPTEFLSLSENIAQNITSVKSAWITVEKAIKVIGTSRDNQQMRDKLQNVQKSANQKVKATTRDLQRLTGIVRGGDKQQKLQVGKLTADFQTIVDKYSKSQNQIATKLKATLLGNASRLDDEKQSEEADQFLNQQQQVQIQALKMDLQLERENRIKEIECNVLDVNAIMRDLAVLVQQQGQAVDSLEESVEAVQADVEQGTEQLIKASASQQSYRKKVIFLLVIAFIIGIIVTSIIISKVGKSS